MKIPERLYITPYYKNPVLNEQQQAPLEYWAGRAYDAATSGDVGLASSILLSWALECREVVNAEARFAMTYWGQLFNEAFLLMDPGAWNSGVYIPWLRTVWKPCAAANYREDTNRGSWGILGCIQADTILQNGIDLHQIRLEGHILQSVGIGGEMVHEIKRTNSGMWYSYFSLAPLVRACELAQSPFAGLLGKPLEWLWQYCLDPGKWPYRLGGGLWGKIQKFLYPCSDTVEIPRSDSWPANLYVHAGKIFSRSDWLTWGHVPFQGVSIFRHG